MATSCEDRAMSAAERLHEAFAPLRANDPMFANGENDGPWGPSTAEIAEAQFALDHHPDWSPYWEARSTQDVIAVINDLNLQPATTKAERNAWHREQMEAARREMEAE